jgi:hypothetical protein
LEALDEQRRVTARGLERVKGIEPSSEAWESDLGSLIYLEFFRLSNDVSVLGAPSGSGIFAQIPIRCGNLCQA